MSTFGDANRRRLRVPVADNRKRLAARLRSDQRRHSGRPDRATASSDARRNIISQASACALTDSFTRAIHGSFPQ